MSAIRRESAPAATHLFRPILVIPLRLDRGAAEITPDITPYAIFVNELPIWNYAPDKLVQTASMNSGLVIKQLRERRGWTQNGLAWRAGTTAANISRIESGKYNPGTELLGSIAYVFGVHVYELVAMAEGFQPPKLAAGFDSDEEIIVRQFRRMGTEEKELFKAVAATFAKVRPVSARPASDRADQPCE